MATPETLHAPQLGEPGDPCLTCGAALAGDQRYCLECGARRAEARLPFLDVLAAQDSPEPDAVAVAAAPPATPLPPRSAPGGVSPGAAAVGVGLAVLFLGVGVLVGKSGDDGSAKQQAAAPVVTVGGAAPTATTASASTGAAAEFTSDWPEGQSGFTIQLQALPKKGTDPAAVAAAKTAATGKGATAVGALDSDLYKSLKPAEYVVYSGVFKTKAQATKALGKAKKGFPRAKVVKVSAGQDPAAAIDQKQAAADKKRLEELQNLSGADYSRRSRRLPKTLALPGAPPPVDNKPAGGGSEVQTFG